MDEHRPSQAKGEDDDPAAVECARAALAQATEAVESAARAFPRDEDFHFYSNFSNFKLPRDSIRDRVEGLLKELGSFRHIRSQPSHWPSDKEDAYEWLVSFQDDLLEKIDSALDESQLAKEGMQRSTRTIPADSDFFVHKGSKKRRDGRKDAEGKSKKKAEGTGRKAVRIAQKGKTGKERMPVPFYHQNIPRPQDRFDIRVDNSNTPFKHQVQFDDAQLLSEAAHLDVRSEAENDRSADSVAENLGLPRPEAIHPLKHKLQNLQYARRSLDDIEPRKPMSLRETPYTFIDRLPTLQNMALNLRAAKEIAVDLEHHHYRSFQGFVCLMQISTRDEDFIIDTLALRNHIGPCLREIFASSSICKVMHGADHDNVWLQKDFGIYMCNLFDTAQAARVLNLRKFGLGFLLEHFCGVHADKRYQLADWRIRPLPSEMLRYAREDTHYLLYVYDLLRKKLVSKEFDSSGVDPYIEVCKRSQAICWQLYEKELITEASHLQLYQSSEKKLQPDQLAVFSALYSWRDGVARKEDESTGYVLPKHLLFHLAEDMPDSMPKLLAIIKDTHSLVGKYAAYVLGIILQAKVQFMNSQNPNSTLSNEREIQPEIFEDEASGSTKCMGKTQSSPQYPLGNGQDKSAKDLGFYGKMNENDSEEGETMLGENIRPLNIGFGPALVHRATLSTLFRRKSETDCPPADSSASRGHSVTGVQSQEVRIFGGASEPTSAKNVGLRIPMAMEVSSLPNIPQQGGFVNHALRPQTIAENPLSIQEDLKGVPNSNRSTSHLPSGSAFYESGIERSSSLKGVSDKQAEFPMLRSYSRPSGRLGQMLGGFGRRAQYRSPREIKEEMEAKLKAEKIKASVALPFHPFSGPIEGHNDRKAEKGSEFLVSVLGAERRETLPQFPNTLELSTENEREEHVEEFISVEMKETHALGEDQPQPDAYNAPSFSNSSSAEQFHSNNVETIKHRAWWPRVKTDSWMF